MTTSPKSPDDELRALAEAATPGPWRLAGTPSKPCPVVSSGHPERGYQIHNMNDIRDSDPDVWRHMKDIYQRDAAFIAAFNPQTAIALLNERNALLSRLETAEARCARLEEALENPTPEMLEAFQNGFHRQLRIRHKARFKARTTAAEDMSAEEAGMRAMLKHALAQSERTP